MNWGQTNVALKILFTPVDIELRIYDKICRPTTSEIWLDWNTVVAYLYILVCDTSDLDVSYSDSNLTSMP